jgi:peptide/nickel transport system permease protein
MSAYIIRRIVYAIPILVGVNLVTFVLFFFINTPDDMAEAHLGSRRVDAEQIAKWKQERSYDLPYFYNAGWGLATVRQVSGEEKSMNVPTAAGHFRLRIEVRDPGPGDLHLQVLESAGSQPATGSPRIVVLDKEIPLDIPVHELEFDFKPTQQANVVVISTPSAEAPMAVVTLQRQEELGLLRSFTTTVFWRKSVRLLLFQFGKSDDGRNIGDEILSRVGPSLAITVPTFIIGVFVNITVSMLLALFRGTYLDFWGVVWAVVMLSISVLFYVIGAQWLFGKILRLVPISGFDTGYHAIRFALLPVVIGVLGGIGSGVRLYRTFFLEEVGKDYVRTARAKGLPESVVLFKHVLKNAMIPILTGIVVTIPFLIMGSLILESFFAIPGMGSFTLEAIQRQDFAVVQAMVFLGSVVYVIGFLLTDLSYTLVDPRVRLS